MLAGILVCLGEVVGYYTLSSLRGFGVATHYVTLWSATALLGGPVFGLAGWLWRCGAHTRWRWPALGAALMAGAFLSEASSYQHYLDYTGEAVLFAAIGVVAAVMLGGTAARPPGDRPRHALVATAAWLLVTLPAGLLGEVALHNVLG